MKMVEKIWLTIGIVLIGFGLVAFVVLMSVNGWDFTKLSTVNMQTQEYTLAQSFDAIFIESETAYIRLVKAEDGAVKVVCYEEENVEHAVAVQDGALSIKAVNTKKWYQYIGFSFYTPTVTVYLPETQYGVLTIKNSTGDIEIPQDFRFESVDVSVSTGDVKTSADTVNQTKIKTSTGNVRVEGSSVGSLDISVSTGKVIVGQVAVGGEIKIKVSTGGAALSSVTCQSLVSNGTMGDISLTNVIAAQSFDIKRSTGDVQFELCDANQITVETDTGSVKGSLLNDKVFDAHSDTGRVNVPQTSSGGSCKIATDTGNIVIEIKQN